MTSSKSVKVLRAQTNWGRLYFYQKTVVLYQMTYIFCKRFLPRHGDRTVDQMIQAARSGKQNIVEGCADGVTSTEMELKLLNVARGSIKELKEDYLDYIRSRGLTLWNAKHPRYDGQAPRATRFSRNSRRFRISRWSSFSRTSSLSSWQLGVLVGCDADCRIEAQSGVTPRRAEEWRPLGGCEVRRGADMEAAILFATGALATDVTYYAQWTANKYKIKFNVNGGMGTMKMISATYGKFAVLCGMCQRGIKYAIR